MTLPFYCPSNHYGFLFIHKKGLVEGLKREKSIKISLVRKRNESLQWKETESIPSRIGLRLRDEHRSGLVEFWLSESKESCFIHMYTLKYCYIVDNITQY